MTKMKHAWFPVTLSFVLTHSSDRFNEKHSCRLRIESNTLIALSYNAYNYANFIFINWATCCNSRNDWTVIDNKCMCRDMRTTWKQKGFDDSSSDRLLVVPWKVRLKEYTLPRCSSIRCEYNTSATFRGNRLTWKSNSLDGGGKQSWWRQWTRLYT